jgi:hypothetical protein
MPPSNDTAPPAAWASWLGALWGDRAQLAWLEPSGVPRDARPVLAGHEHEARVLYLPSHGAGDRRWAAAAAAHAAAHWRFGAAPQPRGGLKPVQQALLGVLEDARVEGLALRELPGLRALWLPFHAGPDAPAGSGFEDLLARLARSLLDPTWSDPHPWVVRARGEFCAGDGCGLAAASPQAVRAIASRLGNDIGQMRLPFNARTYRVHAAYRDDGSWLWQADVQAPASETTLAAQAATGAAGTDADGPAAQALAAAASDADGPAPAAEAPARSYPEWDERIGRYRRDWCSVHLCDAPAGTQPWQGVSAGERRRLARALSRLVGGVARPAGRAAWGDDFHLMALVDARIQQRSRQSPDAKVYRYRAPPPRRLAVQLLVDASASTGAPCADGRPLLAHMLAGAQACAAALQEAGHGSALMTFASRGRHRVEVRELKRWADDAGEAAVLRRCAGQRSGGSTRLGTGVRHAAMQALARARAQPGTDPVVLVFSDGDVHDVDAPDPAYLRGDLRRAVADSQAAGVAVRSLLFRPGQRIAAVAWTGLLATLRSM